MRTEGRTHGQMERHHAFHKFASMPKKRGDYAENLDALRFS